MNHQSTLILKLYYQPYRYPIREINQNEFFFQVMFHLQQTFRQDVTSTQGVLKFLGIAAQFVPNLRVASIRSDAFFILSLILPK